MIAHLRLLVDRCAHASPTNRPPPTRILGCVHKPSSLETSLRFYIKAFQIFTGCRIFLTSNRFALKLCTEVQEAWSFRLSLSPTVQKTGWAFFFKLGYRMLVMVEIFGPGFLHSSTQRESKGSSLSNGRHAHMHTSLIYMHICTQL